MIKIAYCSDLHLEHYPIDFFTQNPKKLHKIVNPNNITDINILILAGDICSYQFCKPHTKNKWMQIMQCFSDSKIAKHYIYIAGNHEYYQNDRSETKLSVSEIEIKMQEYIQSLNGDKNKNKFIYLQNSIIELYGIKFVGSTLWSLTTNNNRFMNDYNLIWENQKTRITNEKTNELHVKSVHFLDKELSKSKDNSCIVITHHLPSYQCVMEKFKMPPYDRMNEFFASNCDFLVNKKSVKHWICGHTHDRFQIGKVFCNPRGYSDSYEIHGYKLQYFTINES